MLYVREISDLMAAYPGRGFKMQEIVRYVAGGRRLDGRARYALHKSTLRALVALQEAGVVLVRPPRAARGGFALYRWLA
ncbi:MAG: hypothetical protein LBI48_02165 [Burkholderiaceae bacterium]|jgi:hypothetical protein|nr:hypothetical protein [Burkholderiaceae bacterium]